MYYDLIQNKGYFEIKFDDAFWTSSKSFFTYKRTMNLRRKKITQNSAIPAIVYHSRHEKKQIGTQI